ncbi:type II toxin-antitoxin system RelE/ParE family toxin [Bradyrhizobium prioriisuperbiae]|uniref:type II toxin-antitoxin system RelE/ParE family toxin n=1 Tax=Bradyrhizobium prioriisuperbiae TaxID=2854389 RepID=UPI0028E37A2E|nr:type II toxin-antitoxin system RelE/ParE family toxin [Bradyrhizobium prioritasuperba]
MRIRYTLPTLDDLSSILDYISAHSPRGARHVQQRLKDIIDLLSSHPDIGVRTDDPTIRRLTIPPYRYLVFYEARILADVYENPYSSAGLLTRIFRRTASSGAQSSSNSR